MLGQPLKKLALSRNARAHVLCSLAHWMAQRRTEYTRTAWSEDGEESGEATASLVGCMLSAWRCWEWSCWWLLPMRPGFACSIGGQARYAGDGELAKAWRLPYSALFCAFLFGTTPLCAVRFLHATQFNGSRVGGPGVGRQGVDILLRRGAKQAPVKPLFLIFPCGLLALARAAKRAPAPSTSTTAESTPLLRRCSDSARAGAAPFDVALRGAFSRSYWRRHRCVAVAWHRGSLAAAGASGSGLLHLWRWNRCGQKKRISLLGSSEQDRVITMSGCWPAGRPPSMARGWRLSPKSRDDRGRPRLAWSRHAGSVQQRLAATVRPDTRAGVVISSWMRKAQITHAPYAERQALASYERLCFVHLVFQLAFAPYCIPEQ